MIESALRQQILALVEQYSVLKYEKKPFLAGADIVPPSGKVLGSQELKNMVEASLDGWLTTGRFNDAFEIWIVFNDFLCQYISKITRKCLFRTFIRVFHQVRKRH